MSAKDLYSLIQQKSTSYLILDTRNTEASFLLWWSYNIIIFCEESNLHAIYDVFVNIDEKKVAFIHILPFFFVRLEKYLELNF